MNSNRIMSQLFALAFFLIPSASMAQSTLDVAVSSEMGRAMKELQEPTYPRPYYIGITVADVDDLDSECDMGALNWSQYWSGRALTPDVRVGSYAFDNHPNPEPHGFVGAWISRDNNLFALRHDIWLSLDESYKTATADFLRKEALRVRDGKREYDTDDLSHENPVRSDISSHAVFSNGVVQKRMDGMCRQVSEVFRRKPSLIQGNVSLERRLTASHFYNSEGSRVQQTQDIIHVDLNTSAISSDGMRLYASRSFIALSSSALPSSNKMIAAAGEMIADINELKVAHSTSPFGAPALVDPSVSAAIALSLGLSLSGEEERNPSGAQIFRGKLGKFVFSKDLTLTDNPIATIFNGAPLIGAYTYDAEGVAAQKVVLVDHGRLKNFLLSRYPIIGFLHSNGHARAEAGYWPKAFPGNLFLQTSQSVSHKKLMKLLMRAARQEGKSYGLWIRRLRGFVQENSASGEESLRIMPELLYLVDSKTGKLTLVRGLDMVGTPLGLLSHVLSEGADMKPSDHIIHWVPISVVAPSLLLSEVELQRSKETPVKPPILGAPGVTP